MCIYAPTVKDWEFYCDTVGVCYFCADCRFNPDFLSISVNIYRLPYLRCKVYSRYRSIMLMVQYKLSVYWRWLMAEAAGASACCSIIQFTAFKPSTCHVISAACALHFASQAVYAKLIQHKHWRVTSKMKKTSTKSLF